VEPLERARLSLEGLSIGDAFGETFFAHPDGPRPAGPWRWTDDTEMAFSIVEELGAGAGAIDQDRLVDRFARRMSPDRGYGAGAYQILRRVRDGSSWRRVAAEAFGGIGSFGNGAAMRVAPLGAYHAVDLARVTAEAAASGAVTHAHAEGIAGAVAVAVAAALAWRSRGATWNGAAFVREIIAHTPAGYTRDGIEEALALPDGVTVLAAARALGNGSAVTAPDTVPFVLWSVARHADDFRAALAQTATALGDVDTTCAMVGGIVILRTGASTVPDEWHHAREPLPS